MKEMGFFLFQRWNLAENHCKFTMLLPKMCSRFSSYMLNTTRKQRNTSVLLTQCFYKYGSFTTVNSFSNQVTAAGKRNVYIFSQRTFHDSSKVLKLLGTTRPLNPPGKVRRNRRRSGSQVRSCYRLVPKAKKSIGWILILLTIDLPKDSVLFIVYIPGTPIYNILYLLFILDNFIYIEWGQTASNSISNIEGGL